MTDDYVNAKIEDALAATDGNKHDAQKLLITWAVRDATLLLGMTKPHLKALAAGLIDHALRAKASTPAKSKDEGPDHFSRTAIDDILAGVSGRRGADKRIRRNIPPPKSTERQATAMRKLADSFKKKDK